MAPGPRAQAPGDQDVQRPRHRRPAATIHADLSPLGFHASVRSPQGAWYIDPYYHLDQSLYVELLRPRRAATRDGAVRRARRRRGAELSVDKGYYHAADDVTLHGSGFAGERGDHDHDLAIRRSSSRRAP